MMPTPQSGGSGSGSSSTSSNNGHSQLQPQPSSSQVQQEQQPQPPSAGGPAPTQPTPATPKKSADDRSGKASSKVLLNILPKLPSNDSLSNSPGPASPGISTAADRHDFIPTDKFAESMSKLTRKESYKAQRKNYRNEKKRVTNELLNSLKDPSVVVLADWLKIRGTLKSWTKLWCVLYPGMLLLYKSPKSKSNHWVGTILLNSCKVIERPSKKDGFCFKLYNPLDLSIWAPRGPENETIGAVVQPLPNSYCIFRAPSQGSGMCWLDALEISIRNDAALVRSVSNKSGASATSGHSAASGHDTHETQWSEADYEKHFVDHDLDDLDASQPENTENGGQLSTGDCEISDSDSELSGKEAEPDEEEVHVETPYAPNIEEEFGDVRGAQIEELAEENRSLIWYLVKQVRPGMDLSKVVLPTFILEPRSFLDKLSDSYYHVDILSRAVLEDDAFTRMKTVVKWYLSGFYKKPKGLKKPYNPILGETFRCNWLHPNGSKTFYVAEQVSHHPPVSAFYVTNRQDGFSIAASILAKSKFYGNSTSAILDGTAILTLLPRGEQYTLTIPYAHCKGILMGTLTMELGGKVNIACEKTGYNTEIEFKVRSLLGSVEQTNCISGRLKLGKETLATLEGFWDGVIYIKDRRGAGELQVLWHPTATVRKSRLTRYTVPIDQQGQHESERLWQHVSSAILRDDMAAATEEKTSLEEVQRTLSKERKVKCEDWIPVHFQQDLKTGQWVYKQSDLRPWDPRNDLFQYEHNYVVSTRTKHMPPMSSAVHQLSTASLVSVEDAHSRSADVGGKVSGKRKKLAAKQVSSDVDGRDDDDCDSATESEEYHSDSTQSHKASITTNLDLLSAIQRLETTLQRQADRLQRLDDGMQALLAAGSRQRATVQALPGTQGLANYGEVVAIVFAFALLQTLFLYIT